MAASTLVTVAGAVTSRPNRKAISGSARLDQAVPVDRLPGTGDHAAGNPPVQRLGHAHGLLLGPAGQSELGPDQLVADVQLGLHERPLRRVGGFDVVYAQGRAEGRELVRQPGDAPDRLAEHGRARAGVDQLAVPGHRHADEPQIEVGDLAQVAARTSRPEEALSATASTSLICQSATLLSTISTAGSAPAIAVNAVAAVTPGLRGRAP